MKILLKKTDKTAVLNALQMRLDSITAATKYSLDPHAIAYSSKVSLGLDDYNTGQASISTMLPVLSTMIAEARNADFNTDVLGAYLDATFDLFTDTCLDHMQGSEDSNKIAVVTTVYAVLLAYSKGDEVSIHRLVTAITLLLGQIKPKTDEVAFSIRMIRHLLVEAIGREPNEESQVKDLLFTECGDLSLAYSVAHGAASVRDNDSQELLHQMLCDVANTLYCIEYKEEA